MALPKPQYTTTELPAPTPEPAGVAKATTGDSFIEKHADTPRRAAYMRTKLPRTQAGIERFVNEFASTPAKAATMRRELKEFIPEA